MRRFLVGLALGGATSCGAAGDEVHALAGPGARIESFIELLEGSLGEMPDPPPLGDIPLRLPADRGAASG